MTPGSANDGSPRDGSPRDDVAGVVSPPDPPTGPERQAITLVTRLRGRRSQNQLVGGKGAWLDRLVAAGFAVPPTAVVTTEAYRRVVEQAELSSLIDELMATPAPPPEHHEAARAQVDTAFCEVRLPSEVAEAISAAAEIGSPGGLLAARSSATAEDLHATSFAGQYRSLLGLRDTSELEQAVRLVWASLWHPGPRIYRRFHGIGEHDLAMAVIVMQQVPADRAGVAFSVDPGGAAGMVRVEVVEGLGEQLVSGRVTPTVHLIPRDGSPSDELPDAVADLVVRVERAFGEPQDVEWARDEDGLWILQARPITATTQPKDDGFDTPDAGRRRWSTTGIAEMLPGVLPPLRWDVCRLLVEESVRRHEDQLADLPGVLTERDLLGRVRGRAALDADLIETLRAATTGRVGRLEALRRSLASTRARRRAKWEAATACVAAAELADLLPDPGAMGDADLLALRRRVIDLAGRAMSAEVAIASAAVATTARLEAALAHHLEPESLSGWVQRVTARTDATVAGWPQRALEDALAGCAREQLEQLAATSTWEQAGRAVGATEGGRAVIDRLAATIERAGSAAVFAGPTWSEQPQRWWPPTRDLILRHATAQRHVPEPDHRTDADARLRSVPERIAEEAAALDELLDGLAANPDWVQVRIQTAQVIDLRRRTIRRLAEEAGDLLERRERTKAAVLSLGGIVRRLHLELGRRLARADVLEAPEDVELLGEHELVAALRSGRGHAPSMAELARRRRWSERCDAAGPLPEDFEGHPDPVRPPAASGDRFQGWSAAPGRAEGRARVLRDSTAGGLRRGDVLVATTTDASWAPLFMSAAAVVVEEGGPLSHAAILARELGIPAVVNLPGIVGRLEHEQRVVAVDGDLGEVTVLDEAEGPGSP